MFSDAVINFYLNTKDALGQLGKLQDGFAKTADKIQNNFITKLGGLALGAAGIKGLTGVYDEAVKIQNLAESWNLPVEKVSQFANAFTMLGGSTDEAMSSIDKLQNLSNQLKFDSSGALRDLSARLGTNLFNKDFKGAINSIRGTFKGLNADTRKKVLDMLGTDNLPMLRMLKMSDEEYAKLNQDAAEYGIVTQKSAQAIRNIELAFGRVKTAIKGVFIGNLEKLVPLFDKINEKLTAFSNLAPETKEKIVGIVSALVGIAPALKLIGTLGSAVFSPMTIAIAGLASAALLLYENWDKVNQAINDYIAESPNLQKFIQNAKELFEDLKKGLEGLFNWVKDNSEEIIAFFQGFLEPFEKIASVLASFANWGGEAIVDAFSSDTSRPIEYNSNLSSDPDYVRARAEILGNNINNTRNTNNNQVIHVDKIIADSPQDFVQWGQQQQVQFGSQTLSFNSVGGIR